MSARYAICYTPPPFSALARFGAGVIGYDCFDAVEVPRIRLDGIDPNIHKLMTVDPRRYGFHATIVPPFLLRGHTEDGLVAAAGDFAAQTRPLRLGSFAVSVADDRVALVIAETDDEISKLAAKCLNAFESFRAPLQAVDREGRDDDRFHMALTGALPDNLRDDFRGALARAFAERSGDTFEFDAISVMRQTDPGSRFQVLRRCRLRG